jgi:hypothetical protein
VIDPVPWRPGWQTIAAIQGLGAAEAPCLPNGCQASSFVPVSLAAIISHSLSATTHCSAGRLRLITSLASSEVILPPDRSALMAEIGSK